MSEELAITSGQRLVNSQKQILDWWVEEQLNTTRLRRDLISRENLYGQCGEFLASFLHAYVQRACLDTTAADWEPVRKVLSQVAESRAAMGFTPSETANFILSLKSTLVRFLLQDASSHAQALVRDLTNIGQVVDDLGLFSMEQVAQVREDLIAKQYQAIMELSTPVIKIWDRMLLLPIIGTVDTARASHLMEELLSAVAQMEARVAIIDVTGVSVMDTKVLHHLVMIIRAVRMIGSDCVITGITPVIAFTMTKLAVDFSQINSKGSLRAGLLEGFRLMNLQVTPLKKKD